MDNTPPGGGKYQPMSFGGKNMKRRKGKGGKKLKEREERGKKMSKGEVKG